MNVYQSNVKIYCFCRHKRTLNSKKYGVDLIRFTHAANTAVHCSTKVDGILENHCVSPNPIFVLHEC